MTEIKVQPKERKSAKWPWLLLLLIPIAWLALRGGDRTEQQRAGSVADTSAYVAPAGSGATEGSGPGAGATTGGATSTSIGTTGTGTAGTGTAGATGTGTTGTGTRPAPR